MTEFHESKSFQRDFFPSRKVRFFCHDRAYYKQNKRGVPSKSVKRVGKIFVWKTRVVKQNALSDEITRSAEFEVTPAEKNWIA